MDRLASCAVPVPLSRNAYRCGPPACCRRRSRSPMSRACSRSTTTPRVSSAMPFIVGTRHLRTDPSSSALRSAAGTTGSVDTSAQPIHFAGEGDIDSLSIAPVRRRPRRRLDARPRFDRRRRGHFHADVIGTDSRTMTLTGGGRLSGADRVQRHAVGCRRVRRDRGRHAARDLTTGVCATSIRPCRSPTSDTRRR